MQGGHSDPPVSLKAGNTSVKGVATVENSGGFSKTELPYDRATPLQGAYPREKKMLIHKNTSTPMFTATLFTIVKMWR